MAEIASSILIGWLYAAFGQREFESVRLAINLSKKKLKKYI